MQEEVDVQRVIKVMLVEDHADFRRLVAALLDREPDLEVVAEASSLEETHRHAARASDSTWPSWIWGFPMATGQT